MQNLELSVRAENLSRTQLTQAILGTAREAHRKVAEQLTQAVRPLIQDSEAMRFLESQVPLPDESGGRAHGSGNGDGYDNPDSGSIMR